MYKFNKHIFNTNEKTSSCSHLYFRTVSRSGVGRYNHKRGNGMRANFISEINFANGRTGRCSGCFRTCHRRTREQKGRNVQRTGILTQKLLLLCSNQSWLSPSRLMWPQSQKHQTLHGQ